MTKLAKEALIKPEQLSKLKELFPQAVVDGKVDFVSLKALLGEQVEESNEKYQFTWNGKQNAIAHAQNPSLGTLREDKASSKNFDSTENLYIEGDNLEVLKLLQKTYQGKIKMIYIDPPYNTGNDFVYKDDFKDNVKNYLELTNQKNKSNAETSGRYHTDWLNMMYPRLMLARNLLTEDGVIFISIDDNEQSNLKKICDEIFGEGNFVTNFIWKRKTGSSDTKTIATLTEYIICYSKNNLFHSESFSIDKESYDIDRYKLSDEFIEQRGKHYIDNLDRGSLGYVESLDFGITAPDGKVVFPNDRDKKFNDGWRWTWGKQKVEWGLNNGFIEFRKNKHNNWSVCRKNYLKVDNEGNPIDKGGPHKNLILDIINTTATIDLQKIFDIKVFDYSKPIDLIIKIINVILFKNTVSIILDFFSGSGTTAHAVMKLNAEDGGNRKFIMVQLPEKTAEDSEAFKAGYQNICEIGKERIRRAGEKVKKEMLEKDASADVSKLDVGFKVFKLDSTNIKPWDGTQDINQMLIEASGNVVKKDRTDLDVVHELMLMYGVFNEEVEEIKINGKTLYSIGENFLLVCLFQAITKQDIEAIIKLKPKNVIFNDAGFENDNVKINAELTLKNHGVEDIKSL